MEARREELLNSFEQLRTAFATNSVPKPLIDTKALLTSTSSSTSSASSQRAYGKFLEANRSKKHLRSSKSANRDNLSIKHPFICILLLDQESWCVPVEWPGVL